MSKIKYPVLIDIPVSNTITFSHGNTKWIATTKEIIITNQPLSGTLVRNNQDYALDINESSVPLTDLKFDGLIR